jgi:hypothetical protein
MAGGLSSEANSSVACPATTKRKRKTGIKNEISKNSKNAGETSLGVLTF